MRLVIIGGAGAGKGTQAQRLCSKLGIPWIATGDILLQAIAHQTTLGLQVLEPDATDGWLLDGYPRTAFQAEELDFLLNDLGQKLDWAIWLDVPESVMLSRSLQRQRFDDQPEILQRRIALFRDRTIPILEYYGYRHRLLTINGTQSPEQVQQEIWQKLGF